MYRDASDFDHEEHSVRQITCCIKFLELKNNILPIPKLLKQLRRVVLPSSRCLIVLQPGEIYYGKFQFGTLARSNQVGFGVENLKFSHFNFFLFKQFVQSPCVTAVKEPQSQSNKSGSRELESFGIGRH